jgi:hypothetical protein
MASFLAACSGLCKAACSTTPQQQPIVQGHKVNMLKLLKPYSAGQAGTALPTFPAAEPGQGVLPFEKSLERAIAEMLVAAGANGASSEDIQSQFKLTSKLTGHIMQRFKASYKVHY